MMGPLGHSEGFGQAFCGKVFLNGKGLYKQQQSYVYVS